ncbi:hypothetical protein F4824DRAFT_481441 [Ustulina deusta]|nr:hypothetical protein F4824DRAFT_481441 [Ustulina deusta]
MHEMQTPSLRPPAFRGSLPSFASYASLGTFMFILFQSQKTRLALSTAPPPTMKVLKYLVSRVSFHGNVYDRAATPIGIKIGLTICFHMYYRA